MQNGDLQSKIAPPILPARILHRERLVTYLEKAVGKIQKTDERKVGYKLVLLCAPAGYGKTTLLADFACSTSLPCCWYFLEREDGDYTVFLQTLLKSLQRLFPSLQALESLFKNVTCKETLSPACIYQPALDALSLALAEEVSGQDFVLCLCNYEKIHTNTIMTQIIHYLLKKLPSTVTLIVESRVPLGASFAPLFAQQQICTLNKAMLRFTPQDIVALARLRGLGELAENEAEQLARDFDGWIAGLLLATPLGAQISPNTNPGTTGSHEQSELFQQPRSMAEQRRELLLSYLLDEVFSSNEELKNFLRSVCILQEMEPELCDALLETAHAREWLTKMEQQELFTTSQVKQGRLLYTCLPLVRDLLRERLKKSNPERFSSLHQRAAWLWQSRGCYEQALYHALEAQAYELAAELLLACARSLLQQGEVDLLKRWLEALPSSMLEQHPHLLAVQAYILLEFGQHQKAFSQLERALLLLPCVDTEQREAEKALLLLEIQLLRSKALFQRGEYSQARQICLQVLEQLPEQEGGLRAEAEMRLGICACLQGDFSTAIIHLQQALQLCAQQLSLNRTVAIHSALANTYYLFNKLDLAEHHLLCAINYCEQGHNRRGLVNNRILQGLILGKRGLFAEAEAALQQALIMARSTSGYQRGEAYALANLGSLALARGDCRQALAYCQEALALAHQYANHSLCNTIYSTLALAYLSLGDQTSAQLFIEAIRVEESGGPGSGYEWSWSKLTESAVHLSQGHYEQAYTSLTEIVAFLRKAGLQQEQLLATLRLAICQLARRHVNEAVELLEEVGRLLKESGVCKHLVLGEMAQQEDLRTLIQSEPRLKQLRALLAIEQPLQQPSPIVQRVAAEIGAEQRTSLQILAFGEPAVLVNGRPIRNWRRMSAMELFFFLLESNHPLSREQVTAALWPEDCEQVDKAFHMALYYLRKTLGKECVVFSAAGYSLNLAASYGESVWYDVREFQQRWTEARQALVQGNSKQAQQALLTMVELYRGDYGRPFYSDWCCQRRDELRTIYLEALCQLAQIAWTHQEIEACLHYWRKALSVDNCLEQAYYGIMLCYIVQGKRSAALRQYQLCQETLRQELGVDPGSLLQSLYQWLKSTPELAQAAQDILQDLGRPFGLAYRAEDSRPAKGLAASRRFHVGGGENGERMESGKELSF